MAKFGNKTDMIFLWLFVFFASVFSEIRASDGDECDLTKKTTDCDSLNQEQFLTKLLDSARYDKLLKPDTSGPLPIFVQMELSHVETSDQVQFMAHLTVQYQYNDPRLKYSDFSPKRTVILGEEALRTKIWIPHVIIRNQKDSTIMGMDGKDMFLSIGPAGDVTYVFRISVTFYCWTDLKKFPFDSQNCDLRWESWIYNMSSLILHWDQDAVKVVSNLHLTQFKLDGIRTDESEYTVPYNTKGSLVGNFSELVFKFTMTREIGHYWMNYFLPSILLVCTSWVTFWLQADAGPPRATLGTSTVVAFITLNGGLASSLPKVSYVKASDIWFLACAVFIFLSLVEFAFVNVIWRRKKKVELKENTGKYILKGALTPSLARRELRKAESLNSLYRPNSISSMNGSKVVAQHYLTIHDFPSVAAMSSESSTDLVQTDGSTTAIHMPESQPPDSRSPTWHSMTPQEVAIWIDRKSRFVFPLAFAIFNILYWTFVYTL